MRGSVLNKQIRVRVVEVRSPTMHPEGAGRDRTVHGPFHQDVGNANEYVIIRESAPKDQGQSGTGNGPEVKFPEG